MNTTTALAASCPDDDDNNLDSLANRIKAENDQLITLARQGLQHARTCGVLLGKAKARGKQTGEIPHGQWGTWVKEKTGLSLRTAAVYVQIAENWQRIESAKPHQITDLSINEAAGLLATRKRVSAKVTNTPKATEPTPQNAPADEPAPMPPAPAETQPESPQPVQEPSPSQSQAEVMPSIKAIEDSAETTARLLDSYHVELPHNDHLCWIVWNPILRSIKSLALKTPEMKASTLANHLAEARTEITRLLKKLK